MSFNSFWGGNTGRAIRRESTRVATTGIWFTVIFTIVLIVLDIVFSFTGLTDGDTGQPMIPQYHIGFNNACVWFILIYNIVAPLNLKNMLSFGLTRGQFASGIIGAGVAISAGVTAFSAIVSAVVGQFDPASLPTIFLHALFFCMLGWLVAVGFQYRNVFTAAAGIAACVFLIYAKIRYVDVEQVLGTYDEFTGSSTFSALGIAVFAAASVLLAAGLRLLTKRIPIRC
jgi:hypothetical protein